MLRPIRRMLSYRFFPVSFTILTILLLCIPGSMVPGTGIFGLKHLDKFVHVVLFGLNVLFWGWQYAAESRPHNQTKKMVLLAVLVFVILGIAMEFVQLYFIPFRDFDNGDIVADTAGALIAGIWLIRD